MLLRMARWYELQPADESIFETAPEVYRYRVRLSVAPERVWESLTSDASLSAWRLPIRRLTWTSPRPFGVGTTREIELSLRTLAIRERFFRWDEGRGYSFYVEALNRPGVRRFAEDYVVEPDGAGAAFTWTIALEPVGALTPVMKLLRPVNRAGFGQVTRAAKKQFA
jgi:hypothetical protein